MHVSEMKENIIYVWHLCLALFCCVFVVCTCDVIWACNHIEVLPVLYSVVIIVCASYECFLPLLPDFLYFLILKFSINDCFTFFEGSQVDCADLSAQRTK